MATITCFAGSFAPKNWAFCDGQILSISTNQALFSLLGTTYGGNGINTFALPDLRGRRPVSQGTQPGRQAYVLGEVAGSESTILLATNIPTHTHSGVVKMYMDVESTEGSVSRAINTYPAGAPDAYAPAPGNTEMAEPVYTAQLGLTGKSQPVSTLMPYLVVNYIICVQGIYPSRG